MTKQQQVWFLRQQKKRKKSDAHPSQSGAKYFLTGDGNRFLTQDLRAFALNNQ